MRQLTRRALCAIILCAAVMPALATTRQAVPKPETLASGVLVTHVKAGAGAMPTARSLVRVHYRGTLDDGTEFDSSYKRNNPVSFYLREVIPCWTDGVQRMKVGGKASLRCPAATAYGERGIPGAIPPNSLLNFEVELLAIEN